MRIALIAPPFISVPPKLYGGTELFVAQLALGLKRQGHEVVVYANGESTIGVEVRWLYQQGEWPIRGEVYDNLKDLNHATWAVRDAIADCDLVHINNVPALFASRFTALPFVYTIHHPHEPELSAIYSHFPDVHYVAISRFQAQQEDLPRLRAIHHGVDPSTYPLGQGRRAHLAFLGRIAPMKGAHIAIAVARKAGMPLKLAGEVQPRFQEYFDREIKPHLDGKDVEYVGEAGPNDKRELLSDARALLFPIQWHEPFGLVMIEAMACGTPVLALPGGSVAEVVRDGISGYICHSPAEMAERTRSLALDPAQVRSYVEQEFSLDAMVTNYMRLYNEILSRSGQGPLSESERAVA
jgi:glycosyltransferase involved in cell wall biosynthesis